LCADEKLARRRWELNIRYKLKQHENAVSPIIAWLLILIILSTATATILFSVMKPMADIKTKSATDAVAKAFEEFDSNIINSLSSTSIPKKMEISVDGGILEVDPVGDRIAVMYTYSDAFDFTFDGMEDINLGDSKENIEDYIENNGLITIIKEPLPDIPPTPTKDPTDNHIDVDKLSSGTGLLIQLRHIEYPLDDAASNIADPACEEVPFACIWVFDLGRLTYNSYDPTGDELDPLSGGQGSKVIYENRAVIRDNSETKYVQFSKNIVHDIDNQGKNIIQLSLGLIRGGPISVSGGGVYQLDFRILNNYVRNTEKTIVYHLKIQIRGDYMDEWYEYLTCDLRSYSFARQTGSYSDTLLFNSGQETNLVLSTFVVDVININVK